jgi:predicted component of type VI protein secretion system
MNRPLCSLALLVLVFVALAGCASSSSRSSPPPSSSGSSPRVRCLTDPSRDSASTSRPMFFLFCAESP